MCMKLLRRFSAFVSALVLCFSLAVPALADDVSIDSFPFRLVGSDSSSILLNLTSGATSQPFFFATESSGIAWSYMVFGDANIPANGSIGVYLSFFYFSVSTGASQNKKPSSSDFSFYSSDIGGVTNRGTVSVKFFVPQSNYVSMSDGVSLIGRISATSGDPLRVSELSFSNGGWNNSWPSKNFTFIPIRDSFPANDAGMYITSFRVVSSGSSEALDAIEDMASNIAEQNQILSQFYGDIVAVCNQIYSRLGDIQAAQEEANALFSQVINLLNTTNGKLSAINQAMSTYFELLINQLKQEGVDTRTAIADAEARLEAYLKPMIDYFNQLEETTGESASTLPQHKTDLDKFGSDDGYGISDDGQTGLMAIMPVFSAFGFVFSILAFFIGLGILGIIIRRGMN